MPDDQRRFRTANNASRVREEIKNALRRAGEKGVVWDRLILTTFHDSPDLDDEARALVVQLALDKMVACGEVREDGRTFRMSFIHRDEE